jgi:hypothetical protein
MLIGRWRTFARGVIGILIGAIFLWLALRQTSLEQVRAILTQSGVMQRNAKFPVASKLKNLSGLRLSNPFTTVKFEPIR